MRDLRPSLGPRWPHSRQRKHMGFANPSRCSVYKRRSRPMEAWSSLIYPLSEEIGGIADESLDVDDSRFWGHEVCSINVWTFLNFIDICYLLCEPGGDSGQSRKHINICNLYENLLLSAFFNHSCSSCWTGKLVAQQSHCFHEAASYQINPQEWAAVTVTQSQVLGPPISEEEEAKQHKTRAVSRAYNPTAFMACSRGLARW